MSVGENDILLLDAAEQANFGRVPDNSSPMSTTYRLGRRPHHGEITRSRVQDSDSQLVRSSPSRVHGHWRPRNGRRMIAIKRCTRGN